MAFITLKILLPNHIPVHTFISPV